MSTENEIRNDFLKILCENVNNPFIILDQFGNVAAQNGEAANLLSLKYKDQNIFDIVDPITSEKLKVIIEEIIRAESLPLIKEIDLTLNSGIKFHSGLVINSFMEGDKLLIPVTFNIEPKRIKFERVTDLSIGSKSVEELINNSKIHSIIYEIISFYPFTFIGKEKIRRQVDELEEFFWIKDTDGVFILVNEKLSKGLGLKHIHLEGKSEDSFIAPYIVNFFNSVENYIKETSSSVTIGGIPFKDFFSGDEYQTIQFPITDSSNKLIAIIGISQKKLPQAVEISQMDWVNPGLNTIKNLPKAVAFIDIDGKIKHSSEEFCKLFSEEFRDLAGITFARIFPIELADKIKNFLNSSIEREKIELAGSINSKREFHKGSCLYLTKIFDNNNNSKGISLLIDEPETNEDLQKIINRRGRMFEVLIQNNPEPIFIYDKENLSFLEVNNSALSLYGYRRDEFLQMDLTDLYSPEDIQTLLDSETGPKEGKFQGPYRHKKKNGDVVFVELNKASLTFNDREADFIFVKDVSEELEKDKKNQLFKAAFDNTEDLLFVTDDSGFITFINNPVTSVLGHSKEQLEKTSFAALVNDQERSTINTAIFQSHFKETVSLDVELKKSDGEFFPTEITATPVRDFNNEVDSFLILGKIKTTEKQDQPPKEIIKEVIKEVIVEKPTPVVEEKKSTADLSYFSNVFHEILTPINVILGFVQELTESIETPSDEQKEASDIINQNRNNLLSIMNSVIEYSQIEENAVDLKPHQIGITEIIDQLQVDAKDAAGSTDVEFAYGKISSSLKFETDKQKFLRLTALLFKVASKLTKQKKIYFTATSYDDVSFFVAFKDNYSSSSSELCSNFKSFFEKDENHNAKNFGISRLTTKLVRALLSLLNGRFENYDSESGKNDCGFVFPLLFARPEVNDNPEESLESNYNEIPQADNVEEHPSVEFIQKELKQEDKEISSEENQEFVDEGSNDSNEVEDSEVETALEEPHQTEEFEEISLSDEVLNEETLQDAEMNEPGTDQNLEMNTEEVFEEYETIEEEPIHEESIPQPEKPPENKPEEIHNVSKGHLDLSQLSCLYLEDQVDSQILFKVQMKELKEIKFAVSFEETLPILEKNEFDFIVIDINLQGEYNGLDALKIIHRMSQLENIPIIAVTAYVLPGDKDKFIAAGFHDFIAKPIFREKMIESLDRIFVPNN